MAILLLFFIFNLFILSFSKDKKTYNAFIVTVLIFSTTIVLVNEIFSLFHLINQTTIISFWSLSSTAVFIYNLQKKNFIPVADVFKKLGRIRLSKFYIFSTALAVFIFILLFVQCIVYPPNNWDSMSYHMTRIIQWISNHSFENFQTHILRQLYQPCFSEYTILQIHLLTGNDLFNNCAQLFFHVFASIVVAGICQLIGLTKKQQYFAFLLAFLIPEALLEATSTQNDIFHGFFLVATVYFCIKMYKENKVTNYVFLGLSVGLALLSKTIAYLYLPVTGAFVAILILYRTFKQKEAKSIQYALLTLLLILGINLPHSYRNYSFSNDIMGTSKQESQDYVNEEINVTNTISIAVKNIGLHLDPFFIGNTGNIILEKFHLITHIDINKKGTNVFDSAFTCNPGWKNHEDTQPNFLHVILILLSMVFIGWKLVKRDFQSTDKWASIILTHIFLQFMLFSALLSWEPWNSRLHIPLFYAIIPIIAYSILSKKSELVFYLFFIVLSIHGTYIVVTNYSREFIKMEKQNSDIGLSANRYQKYFSNQPQLYADYNKITKYMQIKQIQKIGLLTHNDSWEYPLYVRSNPEKLEIIPINVTNYTISIPPKNILPSCILSDTRNESFIYFKSKKYMNLYKSNKHLWVYIPQK